MNNLVYIWCEWDVGQEGVVFEDEDTAIEWLREYLPYSGIEETVEELLAQGLVGFKSAMIIYKKRRINVL